MSASREAVAAAARRNLFARAFKAPTQLPEGLDAAAFAAHVEALIAARTLNLLGLARRAGDVEIGIDACLASLRRGAVGAAFTAREAGADGAAKMTRAAGEAGATRVIGFDGGQISAALGLNGVRHCAVRRGPATTRIIAEARRLNGFRPTTEPPAGSSAGEPACRQDAPDVVSRDDGGGRNGGPSPV